MGGPEPWQAGHGHSKVGPTISFPLKDRIGSVVYRRQEARRADQFFRKYLLWLILDKRITRLSGNLFHPNKRVLQMDITYDCNFHCASCCRSCSQAPAKDQMTLDQVEKFVRENVETRKTWDYIRLMGGEPTLHPDFLEVLDIMRAYRKAHAPRTRLGIITAHTTEEMRRMYGDDLGGFIIESAPKDHEFVKGHFYAFNAAPVDLPRLRRLDFSNGCWVTQFCGMGLNRYGYYICGNGAGIDRVFGFDVGRKRMPGPGDEMTEQLQRLCMYCGSFHHQLIGINIGLEGNLHVSRAWVEAYRRYRERRPTLTAY